jgi:hypothetical protein
MHRQKGNAMLTLDWPCWNKAEGFIHWHRGKTRVNGKTCIAAGSEQLFQGSLP